MPTNLLKQKSTYFKNLSSGSQEIFVSRLFQFMEAKDFIGREGLVITDEIKVLISASAIQLTFGLEDFTISHLHTINVFPKVFFSKFYNTSFKGLNTQNGVLSLSWNDFKEGYANENDKVNLGLHELAHALNIQVDEDESFDNHFSSYFTKWEVIAKNDFIDLKEGKNKFLRSYGGTNMHEFFAVCIESFFEAPLEFREALPHLYNFLMLMLNQDPANETDDYRVKIVSEKDQNGIVKSKNNETRPNQITVSNSNFDAMTGEVILPPSFLQHFIKTKGIYIAMVSTFIGLFAGIPLLIWFWSCTVISIGGILILLFLCGSLGLIQWKFVRNHLDMEYHQFAMYSFSGFGMCLINIIFCLNFFIHVKTYTKTYDVVSIASTSQGIEVVLAGDGHNVPFERNIGNYINEHFTNIPDAQKITVKVNTGLFGFDMIEDCTVDDGNGRIVMN
ncbi:MAG: zinc-dependent peptidase [Bacteroidia bacterium]